MCFCYAHICVFVPSFKGRFDVNLFPEVRLIGFLCTIPIQARRLGRIFYSSVWFLLNLLLVVLLLVLSLALRSNLHDKLNIHLYIKQDFCSFFNKNFY